MYSLKGKFDERIFHLKVYNDTTQNEKLGKINPKKLGRITPEGAYDSSTRYIFDIFASWSLDGSLLASDTTTFAIGSAHGHRDRYVRLRNLRPSKSSGTNVASHCFFHIRCITGVRRVSIQVIVKNVKV